MAKLRRLNLLAGAAMAGVLMASPGFGSPDAAPATAVKAPAATAAATQPASAAARPAPQETTSPSAPWAFEKSDVPADPAIRFGTLPNGVRYLIRHNATPPGQASVWLRIDAGSLMENPNQLGLAHFMEHMAFNGTKEIPKNQLIYNLERLGLQFGADLNAATSYDQTFYRIDMPSVDSAKLATALHVLRQQVSAATMDPKDIDGERGVIEGEERLRNSPAVIAALKQLGIIAEGTRIPARNPIGDMSIIKTAPRERFVEYYNTFYRPSRATVIAVGDFDAAEMETKIKAAFADWQPKAPDGAIPDLGKVMAKGTKFSVYSAPSLSPSISLTWVSPPRNEPDTMATRRAHWIQRLALAVLERRFLEQSRLDTPPFISAAASTADAFRAIHVASIQATYFPGRWKDALSAVEQAKRQFEQFGVTQAELDREIKSMRTRLESGVRNKDTRNTVRLAGEYENDVNEGDVTTSPETDLQIFETSIQGLTSVQASAVAKTLFQGEGPIVSLNSTEPVDGGETTLSAALTASQGTPVAALQPPGLKPWAYTEFGAPGRVVATDGPDALGATTVTFDNGVKLTVKHTDFDKGSISVGLLTGIGDRNFGPKDVDSRAAAVGNLFPGGLNKMTVDDVARSLNGHVVNAGLSTLGQRFLISGGTRPEDLTLEMQYIAAFMTDAAFRSSSFDRVVAGAPAGWALANASPGGVFGIKALPVMAGGDMRLSKSPPEVTNKWRMDPVRDDVKRMLAAGPIHIVMVGDVTLDEAIRTTAGTLGALPKRPDYNAPAPGADTRTFAKPTPRPLIFTHNGLKEQALGVVAWPTTDVMGPRRLARQFSVLRSVLQLRVLDVIREKEALAYSPGVQDEYSPDYKGYGYMAIQAATAPNKLPAFYTAVDSIVRDLQTKPVSADELKRARQPMIEHLRQSMNGNAWWFQQLLGEAYRATSADDALSVEADFNSVTPAMIQQMARRYLTMNRAFKTSIVPGALAETE